MKQSAAIAMILLLVAGCTSVKPATVSKPSASAPQSAAAPQPATAPAPSGDHGAVPVQVPEPDGDRAPAPAVSDGIRIVRDGQPLQSTARLVNGTLYLPLPAGEASELQATIRNGRIELGPGTGFDIPGSRLYEQAGEQLISPPLVAESGVVWAPASYFRTSANGWRLQYDAQTRTVTMTRTTPAEHPFPEEIPGDVTAFLSGAGAAPRVGIFRVDNGLTFVALSTAGTNVRLIDPGSHNSADAGRVFVAGTGEAGATDRAVRMLTTLPFGDVGIQVWLQSDGQGVGGKPPARFYVGESRDAVLSREEAEGRILPPVPRTNPSEVVLHYASQLGVEPGDIGTEQISGDRASVKITKLGQVFYAHLLRGKLGWQLVATTWAVPCEAADYCMQAVQRGVK